MLHRFVFWVLLIAVVSASGCKNEKESSIVRPADPWVFRSVLDKRPSILILALNNNMWAAYSTEDCALYKVWKGNVLFDSSGYTGAQGHKRISFGDAWIENKFTEPFVLRNEIEEIPLKARYKGHRFINGQVELMYQLSADGLINPINIFEKVEYQQSNTGNPVFQRIFRMENAPSDLEVVFRFNVSSIAVKENIKSNGNLKIFAENTLKKGNINALNADAELVISANEATTLDIILLDIPLLKNPNVPVDDDVDDEEVKNIEGARLIAKSDCKTCHNKNIKAIGPAYTSIAKRYQPTEENIAMLVSKVKNGGSGIWGQQVMNAHPHLADTDIEKMVKYILSLYDHPARDSKSRTN